MGPETRSLQRLVPVGGRASVARGGGARPLASLAPRGVGGILDAALEILRARFWTCLALAVPLWVPVQVLGTLLPPDVVNTDTLALGLAQIGLSFAVQSVVVGLVCLVVYGELQGRPASLGAVLAKVLRRAPALLLLTVVTALLTGFGLACCLVPGILAAWLLMVAPAALILEGLGGRLAVRRSAFLMSRGFWRWLGVVVTQTCLVLPLSLASMALSEPSATELIEGHLGWPPGVYDTVSILLSSSIMGLVTAFSAVVMTVFYLDSRVRHEGFDLQMRFERLSGGGQRS